MTISNGKNVSTTIDMWYDIKKIKYDEKGNYTIFFMDKNKKNQSSIYFFLSDKMLRQYFFEMHLFQ